jgi:glyoxylase-like metal-dependent hydrolase (beta-lactamase superfamily II)
MNTIHVFLLGGLLAVVGLSQNATAADEFDYPLNRITDKIQVIYGPLELPDENNRGFRNNVVIVNTSAGTVLFDPGGSAWAGEMVAKKLQAMSDKTVVAVFNSHAHGDHWLGNEGIRRVFPDAVIYGHPRMKARLESNDGPQWLETINRVTNGKADGTRVVAPDKTVNDGDVIQIGDTGFHVIHTGRAHTDNDIMIEIVGEDAVFTGDVVRNEFLGMMQDDASFKGNIAAIDRLVDINLKYYIPGHGKVAGVGMPPRYRDYLTTLIDAVQMNMDDGLADFEMKPAVVESLAAFHDWANFDRYLGSHISRVFLELEAEAFE